MPKNKGFELLPFTIHFKQRLCSLPSTVILSYAHCNCIIQCVVEKVEDSCMCLARYASLSLTSQLT